MRIRCYQGIMKMFMIPLAWFCIAPHSLYVATRSCRMNTSFSIGTWRSCLKGVPGWKKTGYRGGGAKSWNSRWTNCTGSWGDGGKRQIPPPHERVSLINEAQRWGALWCKMHLVTAYDIHPPSLNHAGCVITTSGVFSFLPPALYAQ
jgi:hypothetical protein